MHRFYHAAMPRRDFFHAPIRAALEKDGWTIAADPYKVIWEEKTFLPDLSAERVIAAERGTQKVAFEIKSFLGDFNVEFYEALGQLDCYRFAVADFEPERSVVLAVTLAAWEEYFQLPYVVRVLALKNISVIVVDTDSQTVVQWKK
ncbi:MAG: element excision factor XisH family protein [Saprospiraceae bacterium]